ncbi:MAG: hypothetical protein EOP67_00210 [Sphingomonas sp.]|nr:MAG: hypothetical protein EOP67_00210 [Sphingomonas sp.]
MVQTSGGSERNAFSRWLRTGKVPSALGPDGLELKFNPWHDPADGRFTFAGAGRRAGSAQADTTSARNDRAPSRSGRAPSLGDRHTLRTATPPMGETPRARPRAGDDPKSVERRSVTVQSTRIQRSRPGDQPNPVAEFVGGVGHGLYDVGEGTAAGVHAALTTNPVTTVRNAGRGIAAMVDTAIAAEDTPARVQVSRTADAISNASARDIGHATGSVAGNVALTVAPGALLSKVSALRSVRMARPRTIYDPPQIGWVKETLKPNELWTAYNDSATGARAGQAPTLMRTLPDGSKRPVKFDGIQSDYVIDRKWGVRDAPHARAQILRQSQVLAQHRLIGTWEVPNPTQMAKALKILKKLNVTNIKVRVVKP